MCFEYSEYKCKIIYAIDAFIYGRILIKDINEYIETDIIIEATNCSSLEDKFHIIVDKLTSMNMTATI